MSPRPLISAAAVQDIDEILYWTQENFGASGRDRYSALLEVAIGFVATHPDSPLSRRLVDVSDSVRLYHLSHSRHQVDASIGRVKQPRHFILYRRLANGRVAIGRVLHERQLVADHLPDDYRAMGEDSSE